MILLLEHKDKTVTYNMINDYVYNDKDMTMDGLRALVKRVRKKLLNDNIGNIVDVGYIIRA